MGLLEGSTLLYPEGLVLDAELYHSVRINTGGVNTSPDKMALDVIQKVGQRGHYLGQHHTRDYMHKFEFSDVVNVPKKDGGYQNPIEMAREKTDWILENHHPEPLSESQQSELNRIIESAEKELA